MGGVRYSSEATIANAVSDHPDVVENVAARQETKEPMGFVDRTESTMSWTDGTKTFNIAPVGGSFIVWVKGTRYIKSAPESVVGDGTDFTIAEGLWYFYYDANGVLKASQTIWDFEATAQIAVIYWDATNSKAIIYSEERHGMVMPWATHKWQHLTEGTRYQSGLLPGDIVADGDGNLNPSARCSVTGGWIVDEDLHTQIVDDTPQDIHPILKAPVLCLEGATPVWRASPVTDYPVKSFSGGLGFVRQEQGMIT